MALQNGGKRRGVLVGSEHALEIGDVAVSSVGAQKARLAFHPGKLVATVADQGQLDLAAGDGGQPLRCLEHRPEPLELLDHRHDRAARASGERAGDHRARRIAYTLEQFREARLIAGSQRLADDNEIPRAIFSAGARQGTQGFIANNAGVAWHRCC